MRMAEQLTKDESPVRGIDKLVWEFRARRVLGMVLADEVGEAVDVGARLAIEADLLDAAVDELVDHFEQGLAMSSWYW